MKLRFYLPICSIFSHKQTFRLACEMSCFHEKVSYQSHLVYILSLYKGFYSLVNHAFNLNKNQTQLDSWRRIINSMYKFYMFSTLLMHKYYKKIKICCFLFISNVKVVFIEDEIFLVKCTFKYFTCNVNGRRCVIFNYVDIYIYRDFTFGWKEQQACVF